MKKQKFNKCSVFIRYERNRNLKFYAPLFLEFSRNEVG